MYRKVCRAALAILCLTSFELLGAKHIWSGAASGVWSNDANWTGGAPQNGETDVVLVFPAGGLNKTMTNDVSVQNINLLEFREGRYLLTGNALPMSGSIVFLERATLVNLNTPIVLLSDLHPSSLGVLRLGGPISGAFGITCTGDGQVILAGANQYTGVTTIAGRALEAAHPQALGAGNGLIETGTVVLPGGALAVFNASIANEALSLGKGPPGPPLRNSRSFSAYCYPQSCMWGGPITLADDTVVDALAGTHLILAGPITGSYRLFTTGLAGDNLITLAGANTFAGPMIPFEGSRVDVAGSTPATFDLSTADITSRIRIAPGAVIGRLESSSGGRELGVAGAVAGSAAITNGLLLANPFGKLSIRVQSAVLADQFAVGGTVDITSATLAVDSSTFDPAAGTSYVIVANDGVDAIAGTFAGLPEGWVFTANARNYRISYAGGDGNDLTLTRVVGTPVELQTFSAE